MNEDAVTIGTTSVEWMCACGADRAETCQCVPEEPDRPGVCICYARSSGECCCGAWAEGEREDLQRAIDEATAPLKAEIALLRSQLQQK